MHQVYLPSVSSFNLEHFAVPAHQLTGGGSLSHSTNERLGRPSMLTAPSGKKHATGTGRGPLTPFRDSGRVLAT